MKKLIFIFIAIVFSIPGFAESCQGPYQVFYTTLGGTDALSRCFNDHQMTFNDLDRAIGYADDKVGSNALFWFYHGPESEKYRWCKKRFSNPTRLFVYSVEVWGRELRTKSSCVLHIRYSNERWYDKYTQWF